MCFVHNATLDERPFGSAVLRFGGSPVPIPAKPEPKDIIVRFADSLEGDQVPTSDEFPRYCVTCGQGDDSYVILVWKDASGNTWRKRYCASWVSAKCWEMYEHTASQVGFC